MRRLYKEDYADFTVKHFHEELSRHHNYTLGYTVTRQALQASGDVKPAPAAANIARSASAARWWA